MAAQDAMDRVLATAEGQRLADIADASAKYGDSGSEADGAELDRLSLLATIPGGVAWYTGQRLGEPLHGRLLLTERGLQVGVRLACRRREKE